jgi:hypothetical protein
MKLKYIFLTLALTLAAAAHADTLDFTVISPSNINSNSPVGPLTWTFSLPQNPTPDIVFPEAFEFLSIPVSLNGAATVPYFFEFTNTGSLGGAGWMGFQCSNFMSCSWNQFSGLIVTPASPLFTGTTSNPMFTTGDFTSTTSWCGVPRECDTPTYPTLTITDATNVPEPSSIALLALGLVSLLLMAALAQKRSAPKLSALHFT